MVRRGIGGPARCVCLLTISSWILTSAQMAVKVGHASVVKAEPGAKKVKKYTNQHLPFPTSKRPSNMNRWKKHFKPTIIAWAGTSEDPFGTNHLLDDNVIEEVWKEVFPDLESTLENAVSRAAIVGVVCFYSLYSWLASSHAIHRL